MGPAAGGAAVWLRQCWHAQRQTKPPDLGSHSDKLAHLPFRLCKNKCGQFGANQPLSSSTGLKRHVHHVTVRMTCCWPSISVRAWVSHARLCTWRRWRGPPVTRQPVTRPAQRAQPHTPPPPRFQLTLTPHSGCRPAPYRPKTISLAGLPGFDLHGLTEIPSAGKGREATAAESHWMRILCRLHSFIRSTGRAGRTPRSQPVPSLLLLAASAVVMLSPPSPRFANHPHLGNSSRIHKERKGGPAPDAASLSDEIASPSASTSTKFIGPGHSLHSTQ